MILRNRQPDSGTKPTCPTWVAQKKNEKICCKYFGPEGVPRDGWQFESLQVLNTYSLLSINLFVQKQNTLNREEIIHNLNYGKITTPLFPTKIFHDFRLGGTML